MTRDLSADRLWDLTTDPRAAPLGQERVLGEVQAYLRTQRGSRTLLFAGPAGVGKRAAAEWLAAYLNCANSSFSPTPALRPCGECESCRLALSGTHPDLKVVAAEMVSSSGRAKRSAEIRIDQVVPREGGDPEPLGPWLHSRPHFSTRVGVIAAADTLTQAAANAILKLLEEPPSWSVIVLTAAGPDALLPTIASRATTFRFAPVPAELMAGLQGQADGHPAFRLGQPGLLVGSDPPATAAARAAAEAFLGAVTGPLSDLFRGAEELAAATLEAQKTPGTLTPLGWLKERLRTSALEGSVAAPSAYAAALDAVVSCEEALVSYAQAPLACTVLALELRALS